MNKWEQFEYVLKRVLPSYKTHTRLSCSVELPTSIYEISKTYTWRLKIMYGSGLYPELVDLSKFCGIEWEHQFYTEINGGYTILQMTEYSNEMINPVSW